MIKKLLVSLLWLASTSASAAHFGSRSMLAVDDDGKVIFEKRADAVMPIASLTKLMTAMVVIDARQDMDEVVTIDRSDVDTIKRSMSRVPVGAKITRHDLLRLALMSSDNRAAVALGRTYPGGAQAFVVAVAAKATALGMHSTTIVEPSGLSPRNVSTARDLVKMAWAASTYQDIRAMSTSPSAPIGVSGKIRNFRNTNQLIRNGWPASVSKTGYIEEAGRCLIMRIEAGGKGATFALLNAGASSVRIHDAQVIRRALGGEGPPARKRRK